REVEYCYGVRIPGAWVARIRRPRPRRFAMNGFGIQSIAREISLLTEIRKEPRTMRIQRSMRVLAVASVVLMGALGSARAADTWFVVGQQTLKATDPSAEIKGEAGKWF